MTGWPLAIGFLLTLSAGACLGMSLASFVYARRYRELRDEVERGGRARGYSERFRL